MSRFIMFFLCLAVMASGQPVADTAYLVELGKLQVLHKKAVEKVVDPVNRRHVVELEQLLKRAIAEKALDAAVKIRAEISAIELQPQPGQQPAPDSVFVGTTWANPGSSNHLEFHGDRTFIEFYNNKPKPGTWRPLSKVEVAVTYTVKGNAKGVIKHYKIADDLQSILRVEDNVTWKKMK